MQVSVQGVWEVPPRPGSHFPGSRRDERGPAPGEAALLARCGTHPPLPTLAERMGLRKAHASKKLTDNDGEQNNHRGLHRTPNNSNNKKGRLIFTEIKRKFVSRCAEVSVECAPIVRQEIQPGQAFLFLVRCPCTATGSCACIATRPFRKIVRYVLCMTRLQVQITFRKEHTS